MAGGATKEALPHHPHYRYAGGILAKPSHCQVCGKRKPLQAHHEDYREPLAVQWLCRRHHIKADQAREARLGIKRRKGLHRDLTQAAHDQVKQLWAKGKMSQVAIGRKLGLSNSTISKIVNDKSRPRQFRMIEIDGRQQNLMAWLRELGIGDKTYYNRLRRGWSVVDALTRPIRGR